MNIDKWSKNQSKWSKEMLKQLLRDYEQGLFEIIDITRENIPVMDDLGVMRCSFKFKLILNCRQLQKEEIVIGKLKKKSNLAEVDYKILSENCILIIALRGFLSRKELIIKYGEEVYNEYTFPRSINMERIDSPLDESYSIYTSMAMGCPNIHVGQMYTSEEFNKIIKNMKQAGERLKEIISKEREIKEVKTCTIKI